MLFLITLFATFLATVPAVYLGLRWERRERLKADREREQEMYSTFTSPGGIIYECRDWARSIQKAAVSGKPLLSNLRQPSVEGARWLLQSGNFPPGYANDLALLLDAATLLRDISMKYFDTAPGGQDRDCLEDRANRVGNLAHKLVTKAENRGLRAVGKNTRRLEWPAAPNFEGSRMLTSEKGESGENVDEQIGKTNDASSD